MTSRERACTLVVPCFNEERRLPVAAFREFVRDTPGIRFLFVDDGSTDGTRAVLASLAGDAPDRFAWLALDRNRGKAEAVRVGMLRALGGGDPYVGFWDADLATPLREVPRLISTLEQRPRHEICFGARVQLLGREVQRRALRHYGGRVFAAAASIVLGIPVYDTQCGAKLFRVTADTVQLFAEPFLGRWTFDVEIIARLSSPHAAAPRRSAREVIYELPLEEWRDVGASQVKVIDFVVSLVELYRIRRKYFGSGRAGVRDGAVRRSGVRSTPSADVARK